MLSRMSFSVAAKNVTKSQYFIKLQNKTTNRSLHLICRNRILPAPNILNCKINLEQNFIRHASNKVVVETFGTLDIPAAPVPELISEPVVAEKISELASAGLGSSMTPVSLVQNVLEYLHTTAGLPWWACIVAITIFARCACFPLVVKAQKNTEKMSEYMPEVHEVQKKITRARKARDSVEVERYAKELSIVMKGRELDAFKTLTPTLMQAGVAISVFLALQGMAKAPLPSMEAGGLWWFTNLCISDPYYILPLMSSTTLFLLMKSTSKMMPMDENFKSILLGVMPIGTFFIIMSFPASTLLYWVTTNSVTLLQHHMLKLPSVRKFCNLKDIKPPTNIINSESFLGTFRDNMDNYKVTQQFNERIALQKLEKTRYAEQKTTRNKSVSSQELRKKRSL